MYAITPNGIGEPVGSRGVQVGWPLADGETFTVDEYTPDMVLAEDRLSLRMPTGAEIFDESKIEKIAELREACRAHIFAGFQSDALGTIHRYPAKQGGDYFDQSNLIAQHSSALNNPDRTYLIMCADTNGVWGRRAHTAAQVIQVGEKRLEFVEAARTRLFDVLIPKANAATTEAELNLIEW